jgi:hypothetical protein
VLDAGNIYKEKNIGTVDNDGCRSFQYLTLEYRLFLHVRIIIRSSAFEIAEIEAEGLPQLIRR